MSLILFRKPDLMSVRPFAALYIAFFVLTFITINSYYLVFFELHYRYILWGFLVLGYLVSIYVNIRYRSYLDFIVNLMALVFFAIFFHMIILSPMNFGSILGQLLIIFLVLRSYILFSREDFFIPLIVSITIILLCSIPSYESNFVLSLQAYFFVLVICLYLLAKAKEMETTGFKYFERANLKKIFNFRNEFKIIFTFSVIALLMATASYLLIPHHNIKQRQFASHYQNVFGRDMNRGPVDEPDVSFASRQPDHENQTETYVGFDENQFEITSGRVIRESDTAGDTVMEVQMNFPRHLRAMVWDIYENGEWKRSGELNRDYEINVSIDMVSPMFYLGEPRKITVEELEDNRLTFDGAVYMIKRSFPSSFLFLPWQTTYIDIDLDELYFNQTDWEVKLSRYGTTSQVNLGTFRNLRDYRFRASTYMPSGNEAYYLTEKTSGRFLERYTQLPDSIDIPINGRTVHDLARQIVSDANAVTDYEKTLAIFNYLKRVGKYTLDIPYHPPEHDLIAYFILEVEPKRGHCELFSSAMAVMLRSLDIPCRMVTGYSHGNYNFNRNRYIIQEKHAHTWLEVYFPEIGWLEFDPTPTSFWIDVRSTIDNLIASASNIINELYVYSPEQFYRNRIVPLAKNMVSLYYYNSARLYDFINERIDVLDLINVILLIVIIASILAIYLVISKRMRNETNYRRLSVTYYMMIIELLRKKGLSIKTGETPSELYSNVSSRYPTLAEPLDQFISDFHTINFAPENRRADIYKVLNAHYRDTIRKIRKITPLESNSDLK